MRLAPTSLLLSILMLTSCEQPPAKVAVTPAPAPVVQPEPRLPEPPSVTAGWHFDPAGCTASITSPSVTLDIAASGNRLMLTAHLPPDTPPPKQAYVPIAFAGTRGNWNMIGRNAAGGEIIAGQSLNDSSSSPLAKLLDGGVIKVGHTDDGLPTLHVPNAGAPGKQWETCAANR